MLCRSRSEHSQVSASYRLSRRFRAFNPRPRLCKRRSKSARCVQEKGQIRLHSRSDEMIDVSFFKW